MLLDQEIPRTGNSFTSSFPWAFPWNHDDMRDHVFLQAATKVLRNRVFGIRRDASLATTRDHVMQT